MLLSLQYRSFYFPAWNEQRLPLPGSLSVDDKNVWWSLYITAGEGCLKGPKSLEWRSKVGRGQTGKGRVLVVGKVWGQFMPSDQCHNTQCKLQVESAGPHLFEDSYNAATKMLVFLSIREAVFFKHFKCHILRSLWSLKSSSSTWVWLLLYIKQIFLVSNYLLQA